MGVTPSTSNAHYSSKAHPSIKLADGTTASNFGKLLEPGLRKIFFETYGEVPEQFSKIFKVNTSKKAKETDFGLGAFGDWTVRSSEFDQVSYGTLDTNWERVYTHKAYTKGFIIGRELYEDEQYRQISKFPKALARAGRASVEKNAHQLIHDGFITSKTVGTETVSTAIYDGKALFATDHVLTNSTGTGCNVLSGPLNDANLKEAIKMMAETVDDAGNLISASAKELIVPPSLEFVAKELVNSAQKAGTDYNDINTIKGALNVVVDPYLGAAAGGSDTAWYIKDPALCELNFFWRIKPEFKWEEDFDTFASKYRGYMRYSYGCSDWRGIVGSQGGHVLTAETTAITAAASKEYYVRIDGVIGTPTVACSDTGSGHTSATFASGYLKITTGASAATGTVTVTDAAGASVVITLTIA